jgi:hypothetical protein
VAPKIGTTLVELRAAKAHLEAHGVTKLCLMNHPVDLPRRPGWQRA